jgi:hypothetical protein
MFTSTLFRGMRVTCRTHVAASDASWLRAMLSNSAVHPEPLRTLPFVLLWLAGLVLCALFNWVIDGKDAVVDVARTTSILYGLPWLSGETIVLYALLRPNTFRCSTGRVLIALAVFVPWILYFPSILRSADPAWWGPGLYSGWRFAHEYWLLAVAGLLVFLLVASMVGARRATKGTAST